LDLVTDAQVFSIATLVRNLYYRFGCGNSWFPWSTSFILRTLLIVTTLVAVGLGVIVWLR